MESQTMDFPDRLQIENRVQPKIRAPPQ